MRKVDVISPLPCLGGKRALAPILVNIIETAAYAYKLSGYMEVTGGGGKICASLAPSVFTFKLYNEIELGVSNFMACLTDKDKTTQLIETIDNLLQPFNQFAQHMESIDDLLQSCEAQRKFFNDTRTKRDNPDADMILSAAYTYINAHGSMNSNRTSYSDVNFDKMLRRKNYLNLHKFNPSFEGGIVTSGDCFELLDYYKDRHDVLAYGDPPYWGTKSYQNNWTPEMYQNLTQVVLKSKMKIMLSDYKNPYYDELLKYGWKKYFIKKIFAPSKKKWEYEHIWVNFDIPELLLPCQKAA